MNINECADLAEQIAQTVIDRIEARDRVSRLADRAMERFLEQSRGENSNTTSKLEDGHNAVNALRNGHHDFKEHRSEPSSPSAVRRIILRHFLSPGDILMLTAVVRDLSLSHPGKFLIDVRTPSPALWENNPYLTPLNDDDPLAEVVNCEYPLIHQSNQLPYHFIHAFRLFLEERLGVVIKSHAFRGDIHLSDEERGWISQVEELVGEPSVRFWLIVSGGKTDFTAKLWDPARFQEVVNHFAGRIRFVQVGEQAQGHTHPPLEGVVDLLGKTDLRQMVRLMYHADGVVCPVTMLMHLAAAVETQSGRPKNRPCVVIAGGREPVQWEAYPHHQYLHVNGTLPCCDDGGCWKSRVVPLGDGDEKDSSLCLLPMAQPSGRVIPACLDMIGARDVIKAIENYLGFEKALARLQGEEPLSDESVPLNNETVLLNTESVRLDIELLSSKRCDSN